MAKKPVDPVPPVPASECPSADPGDNAPPEGEKPEEFQELENETSWIEIELLNEAEEPVPGERFEITMPDGRIARGSLDENGLARIEGTAPGNCEVCFPDLDTTTWEKM